MPSPQKFSPQKLVDGLTTGLDRLGDNIKYAAKGKKLKGDVIRKEEQRRRAEAALREEEAQRQEESRIREEPEYDADETSGVSGWCGKFASCTGIPTGGRQVRGLSKTSAYKPGMDALAVLKEVREQESKYRSAMATRETIEEVKTRKSGAQSQLEEHMKEMERKDEQALQDKFDQLKEKRMSRMDNTKRHTELGSAVGGLAAALETSVATTMDTVKDTTSQLLKDADPKGAFAQFDTEREKEALKQKRAEEYARSIRQSNIEAAGRSNRRSMRWSNADLRSYLPEEKTEHRSIWGKHESQDNAASGGRNPNPLMDPNRREMFWTVANTHKNDGAEHLNDITAEDIYSQRLVRGLSGRSWRYLISMKMFQNQLEMGGLPEGVEDIVADEGDLPDDKILEALQGAEPVSSP